MGDAKKLLSVLGDADQIIISKLGKIEIVVTKKFDLNDYPRSISCCRCSRENRWGAEVSSTEELFTLVKEETRKLLCAKQEEEIQMEQARQSALRKFTELYKNELDALRQGLMEKGDDHSLAVLELALQQIRELKKEIANDARQE